jgi:hypothetical protein
MAGLLVPGLVGFIGLDRRTRVQRVSSAPQTLAAKMAAFFCAQHVTISARHHCSACKSWQTAYVEHEF